MVPETLICCVSVVWVLLTSQVQASFRCMCVCGDQKRDCICQNASIIVWQWFLFFFYLLWIFETTSDIQKLMSCSEYPLRLKTGKLTASLMWLGCKRALLQHEAEYFEWWCQILGAKRASEARINTVFKLFFNNSNWFIFSYILTEQLAVTADDVIFKCFFLETWRWRILSNYLW